ncbi:MAG: hypothetical protein CMD01_00920 [Flavobacteriales bacterium]|nr:hypothetical protein [Flavobacteriales bacterium]MBG16201.1 hypothetical protein [Crocinitomicaceae bacterium]|tara:strand:- start:1205 stop:2590 length:1386 start_codon:yes stop_codon:yes gene_type:complete
MLIALLQFFTKQYNKDATNDFKQQARFACSACLITSLFALLYVIVSLLIGFKHGVYVMTLDTIALLGLSLLFKTKTDLKLISNLYIIFCFLPVLFCSYFSGGIDSPVTPWFIIVPMTASLMMNKKIVWLWVIICSLTVLTFGLLKANGIVLTINFNKSFLDFFYISVYVGLILITLLVVSVYETMKTTALKNLELTRKDLKIKKEQIEEKHIAITDSITYAKRLQNAILPTEDAISNNFNNYFVYYQPKDIVSGDFYWIHKKEEYIYFAVADCTGHGVPGAMVSVVCNNALNSAVNEHLLSDTNSILDKTKELIIKQMGKGNSDIKDGMDIALCRLNQKTNQLMFSGANNPMYIIKNKKNEVDELDADRQSVGKSYKDLNFTSKEISLTSGDQIYLFSDGFADQFGGKRSKKYKYNNFKKFLLKNASKSFPSQKEELQNEFKSWKGDLEQIDDVCILAVQV